MDTEKNKANAIAFYKTAFEGNPASAVDLYVGDRYTQHNPKVADGKQPFIDYFGAAGKKHPKKTIDFVRAVAEGDLVALHTYQVWPDANKKYITMDFFRFDEEGKIIEHWDAIQEIPENMAHDNTMHKQID